MKRIQTVETVEEAHLLISMLESYEIPCELTNDYIIAVDPLMSNAVHGIDILVDKEYVEDASAILKSLEEDRGEKRCPYCNSSKIRYQRLNWWNLVFVLSSFVLPVGRKRMFCLNCSKKFKQSDVVETEAEDDALTQEALSHSFKDEEVKPVPVYLILIGIVTLMGIFFGIYTDYYYSKYRELPPTDLFFLVIFLGGAGYFLYSLLDPAVQDEGENEGED